jgi:hypothetical protein
MRSKFLQEIIDETPFCVEYKVRLWADRLKKLAEFEKIKNYNSDLFTQEDWSEFDIFIKNKS